jgi:hypothetical protein
MDFSFLLYYFLIIRNEPGRYLIMPNTNNSNDISSLPAAKVYLANLLTEQRKKKYFAKSSVGSLLHNKSDLIIKAMMNPRQKKHWFQWLNRQCEYDLFGKVVSNAEYLSAPHKSWWRHRIEVAFIILTFPIAAPILMLRSWLNHGRWQFWQTEGSLFVAEIRKAFHNKTNPSSTGDHTLYSTTAHFLKNNTFRNSITLTEDKTKDKNTNIKNDESKQDNEAPKPKAPRDISQYRFIFKPSPWGIDPLSFSETGYHFLHEYKLESIKIDGTDFPNVMKLHMSYELYNTVPNTRPDLFSETALDTLRKHYPRLDLNRGLFRTVDIHLFESIPNGGVLDRQKPAAPLSVEVLKQRVPTDAPQPSLFQSVASFFVKIPSPDFAQLMEEERYLEALRESKNTTEMVHALETLIDQAHGRFLHNQSLKAEQEEANIKRPSPDPETMALRYLGIKNLQKYMDEATEDLHTYISWLPEEYWLHSTSIMGTGALLKWVTDCIVLGEFFEALTTFNRIDDNSGFFIFAAPHLIMWSRQIMSAFVLLRDQIDQIQFDAKRWDPERAFSYKNPAYWLDWNSEKNVIGWQEKISKHLHQVNPAMAQYHDEHTVAPIRKMVNETREHMFTAMTNYHFENFMEPDDQEELRNRRSSLPGPGR